MKVKDVMKMPTVWAPPNMTASEAAKIMIKRNIGALPIIENDNVIGIVTRTDLLKTVPI